MTIDEYKTLYLAVQSNLENEEQRNVCNEAFHTFSRQEQSEIMDWIHSVNPPELLSSIPFDEPEPFEELPEPPAVPVTYREPRVSYEEAESIAGRRRAFRSNMLRRIKKRFRYLQPFTIHEAASVLKIDGSLMAEYLIGEASRIGTQIGYDYDTKKYFIKSPL